MYVVFDTNILFSQLALKSGAGAAVRFFIKKRNAVVAVPEVVRLELEEKLTIDLIEAKKRIEDAHRRLLTVFGELTEIALPSDEDIRKKVRALINEFDVSTKNVPFSLEAAKSSLLRVMREEPPSSKGRQQFKDGVIWANCLELLKEDDVYFVSADKGFYEQDDYSKGLAKNLQSEASPLPHILKIFPDLRELLTDIRYETRMDKDALCDKMVVKCQTEINNIVLERGFSLGTLTYADIDPFMTENASELYIKFGVRYQCLDLTDQDRSDTTLDIMGEGSYNIDSKEFMGISLSSILLQYTGTGGEKSTHGAGFVSIHASLGPKIVRHSVRESFPADDISIS